MKELHDELLALSVDAYSHHQSRGDGFALRVADVAAGLALKVKRLAAQQELQIRNAPTVEVRPLEQRM